MRRIVVPAIGALFVAALPLFAASDIFLKIDGVPGDSTSPGHEGWIDVLSFSWGVSQSGSMAYGSGGGEGKASFSDFTITHKLDKASPVLMKSALAGQHFPNAIIELRGQRYLLQDVYVSSFQQAPGGAGGAASPELIRMHFARDVTHTSIIGPVDNKHKTSAALAFGKHINNAMVSGFGAPSPAFVQSIRLTPGQNNATIVVCDQNGGANQVLIGLRQAAIPAPGKPRLPSVRVVVQGGLPPSADVKVTNNAEEPRETISFVFGAVEVQYYAQTPGGCGQATLSYKSFSGPPSGYQALVK